MMKRNILLSCQAVLGAIHTGAAYTVAHTGPKFNTTAASACCVTWQRCFVVSG